MNKKRILIVDDEESVLYILRNSLRKLGDQCEVETAVDGFSALQLLQKHPFDLVITDYRMPDMDGLELMDAIRADSPDTRVILMTAYGNENIKNEAERLEAYNYLTKPLEIDEFRRVVKKALSKEEVAVNRPGLLILSDDRYRQIMGLISQLQADVGARCIILTDNNGQIIANAGDLAHMPVEQIASLLSGGMATLNAAGQALDGAQDAINLSYREGARDNLYGINIGQQLLLVVVIENGPYSARLGTAWYYARQAAVTLRQTLGEVDTGAMPEIFNEAMGEAFDSELDKLFGMD